MSRWIPHPRAASPTPEAVMRELDVRMERLAERDAILEFLRTDVEHGGVSCNCLLEKADAIERGEHEAGGAR